MPRSKAHRFEMLLMTLALSVLLVIDTGSVWLWVVPLLVALSMLLLLNRQQPAT